MKKAKDSVLENLSRNPFLAIDISSVELGKPVTSLNFTLHIFQMPDFQDYESWMAWFKMPFKL